MKSLPPVRSRAIERAPPAGPTYPVQNHRSLNSGVRPARQHRAPSCTNNATPKSTGNSTPAWIPPLTSRFAVRHRRRPAVAATGSSASSQPQRRALRHPGTSNRVVAALDPGPTLVLSELAVAGDTVPRKGRVADGSQREASATIKELDERFGFVAVLPLSARWDRRRGCRRRSRPAQ